uniref:PIH1 N-terminal domain-containing protein n=1 Tax=Panagrolaimus davidi TaxID=227884 RepID=A0A914NZU9_9BILA
MKVDETVCTIPLSLGDLDCIKDKSGQNALKFDVVINSDFYHEKFSKSKFYQQLTIIAAITKIEAVHQVRITRSTQIILQNKKVFGIIESHKIPKFPENFQENKEERKRIIDLTDIKDPLSTYQHENVSIWIENGKLFKAIIRINEIIKAASLILQANSDHLLVFIHGEKRIADFYVPFDLDVTSLKAKIIDGEKNQTTLEICGNFSFICQKCID